RGASAAAAPRSIPAAGAAAVGTRRSTPAAARAARRSGGRGPRPRPSPPPSGSSALARDDHRVVAPGRGVEQTPAVGAEVRPAQHGRTAGAAGDTALGVQQVVDLYEAGVDADELGAAFGEEILAEAAPPVQLDEQAAEVAQL